MKHYIDEFNYTHHTEKVFAEDSQGVLYTTKNTDLILRDSSQRYFDKQMYENVKYMPMECIKNIILPSCYLTPPHIGYILEIPQDFTPLSKIMHKDVFIQSGGLKRRYQILSKIAKVLMELHDIDAMYGSISPIRILISNNTNSDEVLMLYSANIAYVVDFNLIENADPYIAPETKAMQKAYTASDVYAFAQLANDLLEPAQNMAVITIERASKESRFFELIKYTMSADAHKRPQISDFYNIINSAIEEMIDCLKCGASHNYNKINCPICTIR